ncbi:hypothetical protein AMTRI_Chr09g19250 [Amborella trichopoda]
MEEIFCSRTTSSFNTIICTQNGKIIACYQVYCGDRERERERERERGEREDWVGRV